MLQRLFSAFPGGLSGVSLLLLRAVFGMALLVEGLGYVREADASLAAWSLGLSAVVCAGLLLLGLLTPVVGVLAGLGTVGVALCVLPACRPSVFDSRPAFIFALTMLLAIIGAGPGRYSLDARMFGRREIIIPPRAFPSEE